MKNILLEETKVSYRIPWFQIKNIFCIVVFFVILNGSFKSSKKVLNWSCSFTWLETEFKQYRKKHPYKSLNNTWDIFVFNLTQKPEATVQEIHLATSVVLSVNIDLVWPWCCKYWNMSMGVWLKFCGKGVNNIPESCIIQNDEMPVHDYMWIHYLV